MNKDITKCAGQAPDGTMVCAYRDRCNRFVMPASEYQSWSEFWRGGDDCPNCVSIPQK